MFGQIPPTEFDLRFTVLGIPVRVHPVFWLTSAFLSWDFARGDVQLLFLLILCIFVSIMVHELGHALMNLRFGWRSEIVLYFFGGYATTMRHSTWRDIAVSAAGPGAGFLLYFAILFWGRQLARQDVLANNGLLADVITFSLFINFVWNAINLMPVLPLDGGQISRELFLRYGGRNGARNCLILSMIAGGAVAAWSLFSLMNREHPWGVGWILQLDPLFLMIMFGYLAFQSYQMYETHNRGAW